MGFNLGAFAGGMAQGGVSGYKTMEDIQSQQKRDEMVALQTQQMRDEMKGKEALRSAIAEQGDMNNATPGAMMVGPAPQGLPQEGGYMTPEVAASEKLSRVRQRAIENGADPTAVMQYANAQRADTAAFNTDKAFEWMRGIDKTVTDKGLAKAAEEHLIPEYNKNKGTLNDGLTASLLQDKKGTFVQFKDKDGKVMRTEPLNQQTFNLARDEVGASMLAAAGPEHFYKNREYGLKSREVRAKEALVPSEIAKNMGAANQANTHASVFANVLETAKTNKAAGEAMQPFLDKLANLPETATEAEKQDLMMKAATAGAQKSKDIAGLLSVMRKPDKTNDTVAWNDIDSKMRIAGSSPKEIEAQRVSFFEGRGYAPAAKIAVLEGGRNPKDGKKLSEADVDAFNKAYPNTQIDKTKLSWLTPEEKTNAAISAVPIKNSDFTVRGGRGVYTVSGIPQTFTSEEKAKTAAKAAALQSRSTQVNQALERDQ